MASKRVYSYEHIDPKIEALDDWYDEQRRTISDEEVRLSQPQLNKDNFESDPPFPYTVPEDTTLFRIATQFNVSPAEIWKMNAWYFGVNSGFTIKAGITLNIPSPKKIDVQVPQVELTPANTEKSTGDDPGTLKGIQSNKVMNKVQFRNHSDKVKIEGKQVVPQTQQKEEQQNNSPVEQAPLPQPTPDTQNTEGQQNQDAQTTGNEQSFYDMATADANKTVPQEGAVLMETTDPPETTWPYIDLPGPDERKKIAWDTPVTNTIKEKYHWNEVMPRFKETSPLGQQGLSQATLDQWVMKNLAAGWTSDQPAPSIFEVILLPEKQPHDGGYYHAIEAFSFDDAYIEAGRKLSLVPNVGQGFLWKHKNSGRLEYSGYGFSVHAAEGLKNYDLNKGKSINYDDLAKYSGDKEHAENVKKLTTFKAQMYSDDFYELVCSLQRVFSSDTPSITVTGIYDANTSAELSRRVSSGVAPPDGTQSVLAFNQKWTYSDELVNNIFRISADKALRDLVKADKKITANFVNYVTDAQKVIYYDDPSKWDGKLTDELYNYIFEMNKYGDGELDSWRVARRYLLTIQERDKQKADIILAVEQGKLNPATTTDYMYRTVTVDPRGSSRDMYNAAVSQQANDVVHNMNTNDGNLEERKAKALADAGIQTDDTIMDQMVSRYSIQIQKFGEVGTFTLNGVNGPVQMTMDYHKSVEENAKKEIDRIKNYKETATVTRQHTDGGTTVQQEFQVLAEGDIDRMGRLANAIGGDYATWFNDFALIILELKMVKEADRSKVFVSSDLLQRADNFESSLRLKSKLMMPDPYMGPSVNKYYPENPVVFKLPNVSPPPATSYAGVYNKTMGNGYIMQSMMRDEYAKSEDPNLQQLFGEWDFVDSYRRAVSKAVYGDKTKTFNKVPATLITKEAQEHFDQNADLTQKELTTGVGMPIGLYIYDPNLPDATEKKDIEVKIIYNPNDPKTIAAENLHAALAKANTLKVFPDGELRYTYNDVQYYMFVAGGERPSEMLMNVSVAFAVAGALAYLAAPFTGGASLVLVPGLFIAAGGTAATSAGLDMYEHMEMGSLTPGQAALDIVNIAGSVLPMLGQIRALATVESLVQKTPWLKNSLIGNEVFYNKFLPMATKVGQTAFYTNGIVFTATAIDQLSKINELPEDQRWDVLIDILKWCVVTRLLTHVSRVSQNRALQEQQNKNIPVEQNKKKTTLQEEENVNAKKTPVVNTGTLQPKQRIVRGVTYEEFCNSVKDFQNGQKPALAEESFSLWEQQKWGELEALFKTNNLNNIKGVNYPPNNGAVGKEIVTLGRDGTLIVDRFGQTSGTYASPAETPFGQRALPESYKNLTPNKYQIDQSIPNVEKSQIIPWFGQEGMGIQYKFEYSIQHYLDNGIMSVVK